MADIKKRDIYSCPKCKAEALKRIRGRLSKKKNYAHFQCATCGYQLFAEYDPSHLRVMNAER